MICKLWEEKYSDPEHSSAIYVLATRNTEIGRLWLLWKAAMLTTTPPMLIDDDFFKVACDRMKCCHNIIWLMHSPCGTIALCRKHGTVLQTHDLLSATFDLISFIIFLFWLYLNHSGLLAIPGTPWTLSCPRTLLVPFSTFFSNLHDKNSLPLFRFLMKCYEQGCLRLPCLE